MTTTTIRHTAQKIVLTATYTDLAKEQVVLTVFARMRFDDGPAVGILVDTYHAWRGETVLFRSGGAPIKCGNLDHEIDYATNTVQLWVPRSCVGDPRWVETAYIAQGNEESDGTYRNYADNAGNAGPGSLGWSERVRRG